MKQANPWTDISVQMMGRVGKGENRREQNRIMKEEWGQDFDQEVKVEP